MKNSIFPHIWRFLGLVAVQGLLLKQMATSIGASWFNVLLYPLFILFLPMKMFPPYAVLLGFSVGMAVDFFYGSPGIHASAGAFSAFVRTVILAAFAPKGGFSGKEPIFAPTHVSWQTFFQGAALFFALHLFWYFSVDAFTFVYFGTIALKTFAAWVLTMIFVVLFTAMFNPQN
jgi:hypothetical protein